MEKEEELFCTSCDTSFTIIFTKRNELYTKPGYCPFCSEALDDEEDYKEFDNEDDD